MNRRQFFRSTSALAACGLIAPRYATGESPAERLVLSEVGCGRATGYAEANKIVTWQGKTHVAWLDSPPEGFRVRIRTLDHASGTWSPTYTVGDAHDNHGGPALAIDSQGFLHIAYFPHHHPMRLKKSLRPNDASAWSEAEEVGERLTYPTLVVGQDDTLYLTCRQSSKMAPWRSLLFTKKPKGVWSEPRALLQAEKTGYAHFMDALAWGPDGKTLHLVTRIYDGNPGQGHTVGYMKSVDRGRSWTRHDGTPIETPATAETVDIVAQSRDGASLRAAGLTVAPDGRPIVLYSDQGRTPDETWIATPGPSGWEARSLRPFLPAEYVGWDLFVPGGVTLNTEGHLFIALTTTPPSERSSQSGWGHDACEVLIMASQDGGTTFRVKPVSEFNPDAPNWLPNIERATGHNGVTGKPGVIYTEGGRGEKNTELLANTVHWVRM